MPGTNLGTGDKAFTTVERKPLFVELHCSNSSKQMKRRRKVCRRSKGMLSHV